MFSITINENESDKKINILCKTTHSARRKNSHSPTLSVRKTLLYETILQLFTKFQEENYVPIEDRFMSYPNCYAAIENDDRNEYAIFMEDLRFKGSKTSDRPDSLTIENCRLAMRELGKFHALSFALKDQRPEQFAEFKRLNDFMGTASESKTVQKILKRQFDRAIESLTSEYHKNILRDLVCNFSTYWDDCMNNETTNRFGVIAHGICSHSD